MTKQHILPNEANTTRFVPIWIDKDKKTGRGAPLATSQECERFFARRVNVGLQDISYRIERVDVSHYVAVTQPKSELTVDC
jgi:hypothetical protein